MTKAQLHKLADALKLRAYPYDDRQTLIKRIMQAAGLGISTTQLPKRAEPMTEAELTDMLLEYINLEINLLLSTASMLTQCLVTYTAHGKPIQLAREVRKEVHNYHGHSNLGKIASYIKAKDPAEIERA